MNTLTYTGDKVFHKNELVQAYYHNETYMFTPIHTHDFHELNIVISGNGKHFMHESTYYISCGDIFIMPPGINHGYEFDSAQYSIFHLLLHDNFFKKYKDYLETLKGYEILFNIDPTIRKKNLNINSFLHIDIKENYNLIRIFDELASLENIHLSNTEFEKECLTLYTIAKICEILENENSGYNNENRYLYDLLKSVEYIHMQYDNHIELKDLYEVSCMSRSSYLRYFKQVFNCTPNDYIQDYRLRQAKSMLKHTTKSLATIANDCGFCDSAHFSRLFKKKYAIAPSAYRNSSKNPK